MDYAQRRGRKHLLHHDRSLCIWLVSPSPLSSSRLETPSEDAITPPSFTVSKRSSRPSSKIQTSNPVSIAFAIPSKPSTFVSSHVWKLREHHKSVSTIPFNQDYPHPTTHHPA